jgi:50S ribosomal protein L16 3-hydroxylase
MIEHFLGSLSPREFVETHYHKFPYVSRGAAAMVELIPNERLMGWLTHPAADVMVVRRGELREHAAPLTAPIVAACLKDGCTLVLRHAELLESDLADLAAEFQRCFGGEADVHVYWTPAEGHGFGWHFDAEDVFIFQVAGAKEYELRKNTVFPWPTRDTLPADMRYEREIMPLMRCCLAAGQCLYVPAGYWHRAMARTESVSLAIGLMSWTRLDVFDYLRFRLRHDLRWRERLPIDGTAWDGESDCRDRLRSVLQQVSAELAGRLSSDETIDDLLAWMRERSANRAGMATRQTE